MTLSRRAFLEKLLHPAEAPSPEGPRTRPQDLGSLAGDLPPELLAQEAERLGLDPGTTDRASLAAAVHEALLARGRPARDGPE